MAAFDPFLPLRYKEDMQENTDETDEPYKTLSNLELVGLIVLSAPFYALFSDQPFRAFVAAISAGVVMALGWMLRPLARKPAFWTLLALVAVAHAALVFFLPYTRDFRFGFAFFPLFFADIYFCARLIIFACGSKFSA